MGNTRPKPHMIRKGESLIGYSLPNDDDTFQDPQHGQLWEGRVGTAGTDSPAGEIHPMDTDNGKAQLA